LAGPGSLMVLAKHQHSFARMAAQTPWNYCLLD